MTKIDIFSGFLGAGKTTLIKKLIAEAYSGEKLVLIENEFGEINIDGGFLKESGIEISEMSAGCICCSLVGDFNKALKEVVAQFHPDRILIEPSGVGKLSDVIRAVQGVAVQRAAVKRGLVHPGAEVPGSNAPAGDFQRDGLRGRRRQKRCRVQHAAQRLDGGAERLVHYNFLHRPAALPFCYGSDGDTGGGILFSKKAGEKEAETS